MLSVPGWHCRISLAYGTYRTVSIAVWVTLGEHHDICVDSLFAYISRNWNRVTKLCTATSLSLHGQCDQFETDVYTHGIPWDMVCSDKRMCCYDDRQFGVSTIFGTADAVLSRGPVMTGVGVIGRFQPTQRRTHQLCIDGLNQAARQAFIKLGGENLGFTMTQQSNAGVGTAFKKRYDFPNRKAMHLLTYLLGPVCAEKAGIEASATGLECRVLGFEEHVAANIFNRKSGRGFVSSFSFSSEDMLTSSIGRDELERRHKLLFEQGCGEFFFHASTKLEPKGYVEGDAQPVCRLFIYMPNFMRFCEQATGKDLNVLTKSSAHASVGHPMGWWLNSEPRWGLRVRARQGITLSVTRMAKGVLPLSNLPVGLSLFGEVNHGASLSVVELRVLNVKLLSLMVILTSNIVMFEIAILRHVVADPAQHVKLRTMLNRFAPCSPIFGMNGCVYGVGFPKLVLRGIKFRHGALGQEAHSLRVWIDEGGAFCCRSDPCRCTELNQLDDAGKHAFVTRHHHGGCRGMSCPHNRIYRWKVYYEKDVPTLCRRHYRWEEREANTQQPPSKTTQVAYAEPWLLFWSVGCRATWILSLWTRLLTFRITLFLRTMYRIC